MALQELVAGRWPRARWEDSIGRPCLVLTFAVAEADRVLDTYDLRIELPEDDERGLPAVREIGGRIPRLSDRHVNPGDGSLCVALPEQYWLAHPKGLPLVEFMDGPLRAYLAAQSLFDKDGKWPVPEWGHGSSGIEEFYKEELGVPDLPTAVPWVRLLSQARVTDSCRCPCHSGKLVRKCHGAKLYQLRSKISPTVAARWLRLLKEHVARAGTAGAGKA